MSMQIPHYQEQARRTSAQAQVSPDEAIQGMRSSQAEMRSAIDGGAWRTTRWHESFTDSFVEEVRDARVFVDVGAELGFYSYLALKHMPDDGRIICVEADPIRCELLREFFAREPRVEIVNIAAHNATSKLMLTKPVGCSATSADVEGAKFAVKAATLDCIIGNAQVDVIKIDIEGAEAHAFEGLQQTLQRGRARIFLEMHSWVDDIYPGGKALIEALLKSSGYAIQNLDSANSRDCAGLLQGGRFLLTPPRAAQASAAQQSLISIVIPALNGAEFIERTLISILRQGYVDLEMIVVDGGSSDRTKEIVSRYPEVHLIEAQGKGYVQALRCGLEAARGSVIGIQHCDDYYAPGAVREAAEILGRYPEAGLVTAKRVVLAPGSKEAGRTPDGRSRWIDFWDLIEGVATPFHESTFVRRELIQEVGGLNPDLEYNALLDLWLRILSRWPGVWVNRLWGFRQVQAKSRRHTAYEQIAKDTARSFELWLESLHPDSREEFGDRIRACAQFRQADFSYLAGSRSKARDLLEQALELYPALIGNPSCERLAQELALDKSVLAAGSQRPGHDQLVTATRAVDRIELGLDEVADPSPTWYARP